MEALIAGVILLFLMPIAIVVHFETEIGIYYSFLTVNCYLFQRFETV